VDQIFGAGAAETTLVLDDESIIRFRNTTANATYVINTFHRNTTATVGTNSVNPIIDIDGTAIDQATVHAGISYGCEGRVVANSNEDGMEEVQ
jgi:hypothetical protein